MLQICISFVIFYQLKKLIKLYFDIISYQVNLPISILLFFLHFYILSPSTIHQLTSIKYVKFSRLQQIFKNALCVLFISSSLGLFAVRTTHYTNAPHITFYIFTLHNIAQHCTTLHHTK